VDFDTDAIKSAFDMARSAFDTVKALKALKSDDPEAANAVEQIELAEREVRLAEAQIAQSLGYELCRCQFPPVPMLKDRTDNESATTIYKCPQCESEHPSQEHFAKIRRTQQAFDEHNNRMAEKHNWP